MTVNDQIATTVERRKYLMTCYAARMLGLSASGHILCSRERRMAKHNDILHLDLPLGHWGKRWRTGWTVSLLDKMDLQFHLMLKCFIEVKKCSLSAITYAVGSCDLKCSRLLWFTYTSHFINDITYIYVVVQPPLYCHHQVPTQYKFQHATWWNNTYQ